MTSIVCWMNRDDLFPGLWTVSDSRVSEGNDVLTDQCPKLSIIHANVFERSDLARQNPRRVLSFGFGFAGSTLIGANVREMIASLLGSLGEITFYGPDIPEFEARIPTLLEIAQLIQKVATPYLLSLGEFRPKAARLEMLIYGYCRRSVAFKVFRVLNTPTAQASLQIVETPLKDDLMLILGDRSDAVRAQIEATRRQFKAGSLNWERTPIIVMANLLRDARPGSIGRALQLCAASRHDIRHLPITNSHHIGSAFVGFDYAAIPPMVGGFSMGFPIGITAPGADGWGDL